MGVNYDVDIRRMAKTCIYNSLYRWLFSNIGNERICPVWAISYANMADADAVQCVWNTNGEDESEDEEMVPDCVSGGSVRLLDMELVQTRRARDGLALRAI